MPTPRHQPATPTRVTVDELDRLRDALLAAVSHDLRTPLTSIKAAACSLLSRDVHWSDDAIRAFCEQIDQEADRLDSRIGNLLDMSRIQSGALHPQLESIDIHEAVETAITGFTDEAGHVTAELDPSARNVRADRILLTHSLSELLDNALRWSPAREAFVTAEQRGRLVRLYVTNDGPGIAAEDREHIFRPFQRLDDGRTAQTNGIGLGLAVARGFIEAMGGTLDVDDTPGGGTTMIIELPTGSGRDDLRRQAPD